MPMKPHALPMHHTYTHRRAKMLTLQINCKIFPDLNEFGTLTKYLHPPSRQVKHLTKQAGRVLIA